MPVASPRWWGWHELDARYAARFVRDAGLPSRSWVLDVGAGTGALTAPLVAAGHHVVAVELHAGRARDLSRTFGSSVVVVQADARDLRLPRRPFYVVANPPFAAVTALLKRLLAPGSRLVSARLIVPRHDARRWAGPDAPAIGRWRRTFAIEAGAVVPRSTFRPPPPIEARVLSVRRRGTW
jgi:23S rRNA (adenine-N6)-dimethyltransferase